jgi:hypothetical protein
LPPIQRSVNWYVKCNSTDARIILAYLREIWLRYQHHSTFTKLIRRPPPNHENHRDGRDDSGETSPLRA